MIDASRWVIAEAWLSLGLRLTWAGRHQRGQEGWQDDDETKLSYRYAGYETWEVLEPDDRWRVYPRQDVPVLGTDSMRHELAHYLVATPEQRNARNFELTDKLYDEFEERAMAAEKVLAAMLVGASRVAALALGGGRA